MNRAQTIQHISTETKRPWDVLIIGGGAVGLGAALDSCLRGYRTLLVEQADFGQATSSRSTKLIHGGVRYLRQGNFKLVREALRERGRLLQNAADLVHPLRFLIPNQKGYDRWMYGAGMKVYDWLAGDLGIEKSKHLDLHQFQDALPALSSKEIRGATAYFDAQFDDSRLLIAMAKSIVKKGGVVGNRLRVRSLIKEAGRVNGAVVEDLETRESHQVKAKTVINATGIFSDQIRRMDDKSSSASLVFSQGIHLAFDLEKWNSKDALIVPKTSDGRVLFAIPWMGTLIAGTTDTPIPSPELEPRAQEQEIDFVLSQLNQYLRSPVRRSDVKSVFAGIRPLAQPPSKTTSTSKVSREHQVIVSDSGLVSVMGGKWTTYRKMAEDTIDAAIKSSSLADTVCNTAQHKLVPAANVQLDLDPSSRVHPDLPYSESAFRDAIENEMARSIDDVLARRTRCLFMNASASIEVASKIVDWLAEANGKDDTWKQDELTRFLSLAAQYQI